ncbi:MAG TPA: squalene synthase HpnC [Chthonomonadales bacterium]|nr:squalene synthase HpnC [Chthonomonadales bacterium]
MEVTTTEPLQPSQPPAPTPYRADRSIGLAEARAYCARIARSHHENFLVGSALVPRDLRPHFYSVYAYCRIADDLGDESGGPERALSLLAWWEEELDACYSGEPRHPVFVALAETNARFGIPRQPYADLLSAFRQDQTTTRYAEYGQLLDYCTRSANPVGRLVLHLYGEGGAARQALSDATCTALQLANFWQDVARDYEIGRIYLPTEDMERFGVREADIAERRCTPGFRKLMRFEVERTRALFVQGLQLCGMVRRSARLNIEMFSRAGLEVLRLIEAQDYDVLSRRPAIPKRRQLALLARRLLAGLVPGREAP